MDMFWWGIQPGYLEDLEKEPGIRLFSNERSALYYWGFNLRRPPFNDVNLRRAISGYVRICPGMVKGLPGRRGSKGPMGF